MVSTGGHPVFHIDWRPEMTDFAEAHERELLEALNADPLWLFIVTCALVVDGQVAIVYAKRDELSLNPFIRLLVIPDMVQEIRMKAGLEGIVVMADPKAYWQAGWSHYGSAV